MSTVQIADIYDPLKFASMAQEAQVEKNAFIQSGVQVADPTLMMACSSAGMTGELDGIKPLVMDEPGYANDNPADKGTSAKLGTQQMKYRKAARTKSWAAMDLARGIALTDPVSGITSRIGDYWTTDNEKRVINSLIGIYKDNVANDNGDMVVDVATDAVGVPTAAENASALNFINALALKGDSDNIVAVGIHSAVYYGLRRLRQIVDQHDPVTDTTFAMFEGKRVIVDDALPAVAGTNRTKFTSILFGAGSVLAGEGNMPNTLSSELFRDPNSGNQSGETTIYSRRTDVLMVAGFTWTDTTIAGVSATYAELADATNWDRIWDPKNIALSFLVTNG